MLFAFIAIQFTIKASALESAANGHIRGYIYSIKDFAAPSASRYFWNLNGI